MLDLDHGVNENACVAEYIRPNVEDLDVRGMAGHSVDDPGYG